MNPLDISVGPDGDVKIVRTDHKKQPFVYIPKEHIFSTADALVDLAERNEHD